MYEEVQRIRGIILSIKCLDEGVDIPAAEHALIIASTQNRREFIQRRGRVLRKDKDNPSKIAKIYDLVTIPQNRNDLPISLKTLLKTELREQRYSQIIQSMLLKHKR